MRLIYWGIGKLLLVKERLVIRLARTYYEDWKYCSRAVNRVKLFKMIATIFLVVQKVVALLIDS